MDMNNVNPLTTQLGNYTPVKMLTRRVRCLVGDWFTGAGQQTAEVGKVYAIDADVAKALCQGGRAEYVQ